jgi:glutamate-1-semialdehyde 2,1-aminomutase
MQQTTTRSQEIYQRACQKIPGGVSSPVRAFRRVEQSPLVAAAGEGSLLYDADNNAFIDYCCGWGALIVGHAHPEVVRVACNQTVRGAMFGLACEAEEQLAERMLSALPYAERVRFVCSGTEALMTAVRLARAYTRRQKVVKFIGHYHGHADLSFDELQLPFNDFAALSKLGPDVAAVVVEPITANMGLFLPQEGFLAALRRETAKHGILLIFDEVVTGFRVAFGGAQELYQIAPDISCFAKIIGGGFPAAAVVGPAAIMDQLMPVGPVFQAGTYAAHPVAMCAGVATLDLVQEPGFYERLQMLSDRLVRPVRAALRAKGVPMEFSQAGSMLWFNTGDDALFGALFRYLYARGIFIPPSLREAWFLSSAHTEDQVDSTAEALSSWILHVL